MVFAKKEIEGIIIYNNLPHPYKNYEDFPNESAEVIELEGFLEYEEPSILEGEKLGEIIQVGNKFTNEVINIQEEIDRIEAIEKKATRNQLLKDGIIVQDIWFDEMKLMSFIMKAQIEQASGNTQFMWGKESGWGYVTIEEAFAIGNEAGALFTQIYIDHA